MAFARELDRLPQPTQTPEERLRQAIELHDVGVAVQLQNLRRKHPTHSDEALAALLGAWLAREEMT
jgi:hypothetical protein